MHVQYTLSEAVWVDRSGDPTLTLHFFNPTLGCDVVTADSACWEVADEIDALDKARDVIYDTAARTVTVILRGLDAGATYRVVFDQGLIKDFRPNSAAAVAAIHSSLDPGFKASWKTASRGSAGINWSASQLQSIFAP